MSFCEDYVCFDISNLDMLLTHWKTGEVKPNFECCIFLHLLNKKKKKILTRIVIPGVLAL